MNISAVHELKEARPARGALVRGEWRPPGDLPEPAAPEEMPEGHPDEPSESPPQEAPPGPNEVPGPPPRED
jgi:hypothetical protein